METNCSWSIDDSRNKFQFGCEWGALIENGKLGARGEEPELPRHLGDLLAQPRARRRRATRSQVLGTPYCGKGEPSQVIRVGHASPACVFADVDVFGGEADEAHDAWKLLRIDLADVAATRARAPASASPRRFAAEDTDFVRFNRGKVRQAGTVSQRYCRVRADRAARATREHTLSLSGDARAGPRRRVRDAVAALRAVLAELADDPLLLLPTRACTSSRNVRDGVAARRRKR